MNKSFTMALPEELFQELATLAEKYTASQPNPLNRLNVQELLRLITKAYLQELRGPTNIEKLRLKTFSAVKFIVGACPHCRLRVDKQDFPVLVQRGETWLCHICGASGSIEEVT